MSKPIGAGRSVNYDDVLSYIIAFKRENDGVSPTIREIGKRFGISSNSHVNHILARLAQENKIILPQWGEPRSIRVPGGRWDIQS